nr:translation initiation factor IF-2-like [Aegilops tauschii subsp. strangulata]
MEGSANTRCIDPLTDLREVTEKNAREAREEREEAERQNAAAAKAAQVDADGAAKAQADAAAKAQADATTKAQAEAATKAKTDEAARSRSPQLIVPLRAMPPAPGTQVPTGGAGNEQPIMERGGDDITVLEAEVPPRSPTADAQSNRLEVPSAPPAGNELVVGSTPVVRTLGRHCPEKAVSAPRPLDFGAASSSAPNAEASSAAPPKWTPGGRTSVLNRVANDVQAHLRAQADALQQYMKEFVVTRTGIRDYHNIRAAAFNSHVRDLAKRTAKLADSRRANTTLQQGLGKAQTALRAKEEEHSKMEQERDRLAKKLADQAELQKLKDAEEALQAEFET